MFGPLGLPEILFILILALLIFGPKRLPEIGRTVGKALTEFRRASEELKRTVHSEIAALDAETRQLATEVVPELAGKIPTQTMARGALTSALGLDGVEKEIKTELAAVPQAASELIEQTGLPIPSKIAAMARRSGSPADGFTPGLDHLFDDPPVEPEPAALLTVTDQPATVEDKTVETGPRVTEATAATVVN